MSFLCEEGQLPRVVAIIHIPLSFKEHLILLLLYAIPAVILLLELPVLAFRDISLLRFQRVTTAVVGSQLLPPAPGGQASTYPYLDVSSVGSSAAFCTIS